MNKLWEEYKEQIREPLVDMKLLKRVFLDGVEAYKKLPINRVEVISKNGGREKVVKTEDIEISLQSDGTTLKIFYGYGKLDKLKHYKKDTSQKLYTACLDRIERLVDTEYNSYNTFLNESGISVLPNNIFRRCGKEITKEEVDLIYKIWKNKQ
jgi:hypothetical protein